MPIDPGSTTRLLPESSSHGRYGKDMVIVHSTGTTATAASNARYFAREDVQVESHFIIGYSAVDPTLQVMDTDAKADANGDANRRGISIEVVGTGDEAFTPWQISELIRIGRWAHGTHGVPLRETPSEDEGGYAWHVKYGAPGPWTSQRGKECPGRRRIEQLQRIIFPAIFAQQEDDMYGPDERNELVSRLDRALTILDAQHRAVGALHVGVLDPTSGVRKMVADLAGRPVSDVDEAEVARLVLAGLPASAIVDAVPAELAQQVVDQLAARLGR